MLKDIIQTLKDRDTITLNSSILECLFSSINTVIEIADDNITLQSYRVILDTQFVSTKHHISQATLKGFLLLSLLNSDIDSRQQVCNLSTFI